MPANNNNKSHRIVVWEWASIEHGSECLCVRGLCDCSSTLRSFRLSELVNEANFTHSSWFFAYWMLPQTHLTLSSFKHTSPPLPALSHTSAALFFLSLPLDFIIGIDVVPTFQFCFCLVCVRRCSSTLSEMWFSPIPFTHSFHISP